MFISFNHRDSMLEKTSTIQKQVLGKKLFIQSDDYFVVTAGDKMCIFEGQLYYFDDHKIFEYLNNKSDEFVSSFLNKIIEKHDVDYCIKHLEGVYSTIEIKESYFTIHGDKLKQVELFYFTNDEYFVACTNLSVLMKELTPINYNQTTLGMILSSHYQYSPSRHTIYEGINTLAPGDCLKIDDNGLNIYSTLVVEKIKDYKTTSIDDYKLILEKSILGRSNQSINIANSTGGWDSTFLITALVELVGKEKTASSTYNHVLRDSDKRFRGETGRTEWNIYELNRAKAIAKHFGIEHYEVQIDFNDSSLVDDLIALNFTLKNNDDVKNNLKKILNMRGPVLIDVKVDPKSRVKPKIEFGKPLHDMYPYLEKNEINSIMND